MENIFVESNKVYSQGFILKEGDLRRITDLVTEQFKKLPEGAVTFSYEIKYKNGAVASTKDLDVVLKQENEGSEEIIRLKVSGKHNGLQDQSANNQSTIEVEFRNIDSDKEKGEDPVKHKIQGQSRDWVFVSSSLLEERVTKIKRYEIDQIGERGLSKVLFRLFTPILLMIIMFATLFTLPDQIKTKNEERLKVVEALEERWKGKGLVDPIETILILEKADIKNDNSKNSNDILQSVFLSKPILVIFSALIFLYLSFFFYGKYYPAYNFVWGGYSEKFNKIENSRKVVIGVIFGTLILGIVVNLLSNYIWEKM